MYWLRLLWAVIRGVAWGISDAKWDEFVKSRNAQKQGPSPESPPPGPFTGPVAPSEPATGVRVDVERKEGEFAGGVPFVGVSDPRVRPAPAQAAPRDGASRRKRRAQPAAATPAEQLCARCKLALEHELTADMPADLAVAQEAADLEPSTVPVAQAGDAQTSVNASPAELTSEAVQPTLEPAVPAAREPRGVMQWERPPLLDRLVTRLSTRGALARLVEPAGALPSGA